MIDKPVYFGKLYPFASKMNVTHCKFMLYSLKCSAGSWVIKLQKNVFTLNLDC